MMIGVRYKLHGLYYLSPSTPIYLVSIISPMTIHAQLGHLGFDQIAKDGVKYLV